MQTEFITSLTSFIGAIIALYKQIGPLYSFLLVFIIVMYKKHSEWNKNKMDKYHFDKMVNEKNKEIERLAEDNNNYRKIYLKQVHNLSDEQYQTLAADDIKK